MAKPSCIGMWQPSRGLSNSSIVAIGMLHDSHFAMSQQTQNFERVIIMLGLVYAVRHSWGS